MTAPCAADGLMTISSPGLRPPSPDGRGISAQGGLARHRLIEILLPPGEGARRADEGRVIRSGSEGVWAEGRPVFQFSAPPALPGPSLTLGDKQGETRSCDNLRAVVPSS